MAERPFKTLRGKDKITGLVPVVPTPLNADETLDPAGFESLAQYVLAYPFRGIWALATAGEDQNLPFDVINEATRLFMKHFGGRVPVLVKTSSPGLAETLRRTKQMADFGIDAAIIFFEHQRLGVEQARRHLFEVAEQSPVPVFLYHNPGRGAQLDLDLMLELSHHPNVAGMKAGGRNLGELQQLCLRTDPDFTVMIAGGRQILAGLAMGASAHTAIPLLAFPEKAFAIWDHVQAGRLDAARAEQRVLIEFLERMPKLGNREVCGEIKAILEIRDVVRRHVSAPFISATDQQVSELRRLIDEFDLFRPLDA